MSEPISRAGMPVGPPARVPPAKAAEQARLRQTAAAFESLLVEHLLETMSKAQLQEGFFGSGPGASTWDAFFRETMAGKLAESSPLGVARALEAQWAGAPDASRKAESALASLRTAGARATHPSAGFESLRPQVPVLPADEILDRGGEGDKSPAGEVRGKK